MIEMIEHEGNLYPMFQTNGNASRFAMPFAKELCKGKGLDIGANNPEWAFPGARMIDLEIDDEYDACNLPEEEYDYIFSSHCLEHLNDWVGTLDYWTTRLKKGGVMFLYLPHYSQTYWRPWSHRNSSNQSPHVNILQPRYLKDYFEARGFKNIMVTGHDLYNAFYAVGEKT